MQPYRLDVEGEYSHPAVVSSIRSDHSDPCDRFREQQLAGWRRPSVPHRTRQRSEYWRTPEMDVPFWLWAATIAAVLGLLVFDFFAHVRKAHEPTLKESATWSVVYIVIALVFGVGVGVFSNWTFGGEYFAGYVTEKALSVDNLFVFLIIMSSFAVPRAFQQKVLLVGIAIALVMRGIFIAMGSAIIDNFSWVFYLFGALLLVMAYKQMKETHDEDESDSKLIRVLRRFIPTSDHYDGDKLTTRVDGKRLFTPMFLVMLAIGLTDVLFALDSIPAIFGLTQEAYIVFTANAFALLGLRQLYFLISGLLERLVYLSQGLAVILGFIAVKLVLHAMHVNEVPFINGGEPMLWAPEIPIWFSLSFILLTIAVATIASLAKTKRDGTAVEGTDSAASVEGEKAPADADDDAARGSGRSVDADAPRR